MNTLHLWLVLVIYSVSGQDLRPVVNISGENDDAVPSSTMQPREQTEVVMEWTVVNRRYILEKDWQPVFCPIPDRKCLKPYASLLSLPQVVSEMDDCLLMCLRTKPCRGFLMSPSNECWLYSERCEDGASRVEAPGFTYYHRLSDKEKKNENCPSGSSPPVGDKEKKNENCPSGSSPPVAPLKKWQNNYCFHNDQLCGASLLVDPTSYYEGPMKRSTQVACSRLCSWNPSCAGAMWNLNSRLCTLFSGRCTIDQRTQSVGVVYLYRLRRNEECNDPKTVLDTDVSAWSGKYCIAHDKYCYGGNVYLAPQGLDAMECVGKCNRIVGCKSVAHWEDTEHPLQDGSPRQRCEPKFIRCEYEDLVSMPGRSEFYRLKNGDQCPIFTVPGLPPSRYRASFCRAEGFQCPGGDFLNMPIITSSARECIVRCINSFGCQSVMFVHQDGSNRCFLKNKRCSENELAPYVGATDYYRLVIGENCPSTRPEDDEQLSDHFCHIAGMFCSEGDIPVALAGLIGFQKCLQLCVDTIGCRSVVRQSGTCRLKSVHCEEKRMVHDEQSDYYHRLNHGEVCPRHEIPKVPVCPAHSVYDDASPTKPRSCRNHNSPSQGEPTPGCECLPGFSFNDDVQCIPSEECECFDDNGRAWSVGDEWRSDDCTVTWTCAVDGNGVPTIYEEETLCGKNSHCDIEHTVPQCVCDAGYSADSPDEPCLPIIVCPANARFNAFASICQPTCLDLHPYIDCEETLFDCECTELCHVWSYENHEQCIHASECGCIDELGYRKELHEIWGHGSDCASFKCDVIEGECYAAVQLVSAGCGENEECREDAEGGPECVCVAGYEKLDGVCVEDLHCPDGMHKEYASCADTCLRPNFSHVCAGAPSYKCVCSDNGLLDQNGVCVTAEECGCYDDDGTHVAFGTEVLNDDCSMHKECVVENKRPVLKTREYHCPKGSACRAIGDKSMCVSHAAEIPQACGSCPRRILVEVLTEIRIRLPVTRWGQCYPKSHYVEAASACPNSCYHPAAQAVCSHNNLPGCECEPTYLYDHIQLRCVPHHKCDCYDSDGTVRKVGRTWLNSGCSTLKRCERGIDGPVIISEVYSCSEYSTCAESDGEPTCACKAGFKKDSSDHCIPK